MSKLDYKHYKESIGNVIIAFLGSARSARRLYSILRERELKNYKSTSVRVAISRLHCEGYVTKQSAGWSITKKGLVRAKKYNLTSYIPSPFGTNQKINTIISFDIQIQDNILRRWLRNQIKIFGYKMLQQSLWLGPGPLPKTFLERLKILKISKNVKIFRIKTQSST